MVEHPVDWKSRRRLLVRLPLYCFALAALISYSRTADLLRTFGAYRRDDDSAYGRKARGRAPSIIVEPDSGIEIVTRAQKDMFPDDWADPAAPTTASSPISEYVPHAIVGIERALHKYPTSFLKRNLVRIYIVDNLVVDGQPSGGVNCPELKTIYVDLDNLEAKEVAAWSEETIHHEFAHLLADNHAKNISLQAWRKLNRPGFTYGDGGTDAIRRGKDGDQITTKYLSQGFVEEYSMADPDEDFATLCERMFSGDRVVQTAETRYPVLRRKADAVISFYHSMDPSFTESYFKRLKPSTVRE